MKIIRCMWGESSELSRWDRIWGRSIRNRVRTDGSLVRQMMVMVYGEENAERLRDLGYPVMLLDSSPFPDGKKDIRWRRIVKRPWHYKQIMIREALHIYGEIIYCDWDVRIIVRKPSVAFDHLKDRNISLSGFRYNRRHGVTREHPNDMLSGNWIHVSGPTGLGFVNEVIEVMGQSSVANSWHDEFAMYEVVKRRSNGRFPGHVEWLRKWESPIMVQKKSHEMWPRIKDGHTIVRQTPIPFVWTKLFCQDQRR